MLLHNMCKALTCDREKMVHVLRNAVMRRPKCIDSSQIVHFGKEKEISQTDCHMFMSALLRMILFGSIKNSKLRTMEVIIIITH